MVEWPRRARGPSSSPSLPFIIPDLSALSAYMIRYLPPLAARRLCRPHFSQEGSVRAYVQQQLEWGKFWKLLEFSEKVDKLLEVLATATTPWSVLWIYR